MVPHILNEGTVDGGLCSAYGAGIGVGNGGVGGSGGGVFVAAKVNYQMLLL